MAAHDDYLAAISKFRPQESIFEVKSSKKGAKATTEALLMQKRRSQFSEKIAKKARLVGEIAKSEIERQKKILEREGMQEQGGEDDVIYDGFKDLTTGKSMFEFYEYLTLTHPFQRANPKRAEKLEKVPTFTFLIDRLMMPLKLDMLFTTRPLTHMPARLQWS